MTEESHYMRNIRSPILIIKDIEHKPELWLERYYSWVASERSFLSSQNGNEKYLDKTSQIMITEYLATLTALGGPGIPEPITEEQRTLDAGTWSLDNINRMLVLANYRELEAAEQDAVIGEAARKFTLEDQKLAQAKVDTHELKLKKFRDDEIKCFALLISGLDRNLVIKYQIQMIPENIRTPYTLWNIIRDDFLRIDDSTRLILTDRFDKMKYEFGETIREFSIRLRMSSNNLANINIIKTEGEVKTRFLSGLAMHEAFIPVLSSAFEYDQALTLEELAARLNSSCEIMRISFKPKINKRARDEDIQPIKRRLLINKNGIICYYCNKPGHISRECRIKKDDIKTGNYKKPNYAKTNHRKVTTTTNSVQEDDNSSGNIDDNEKIINKNTTNKKKPLGRVNIKVTKVLNSKIISEQLNSEKVEIILDSGAETTVLKEDYGIMQKMKNQPMTW